MKYYAELNENNIATAVSALKGEVDQANMIEISSVDEDILWRKYENGAWSAEKFLPDRAAIQLTEFELLQEEAGNLLIQRAEDLVRMNEVEMVNGTLLFDRAKDRARIVELEDEKETMDATQGFMLMEIALLKTGGQ